MERPAHFTAEEAKAKILVILRDGDIRPTYHCQQVRMPKRNVEIDDIFYALEIGEVKRKPEWDDENRNWKYRIEGKDLDEDELTVITVIIEEDLRLKIVTVW